MEYPYHVDDDTIIKRILWWKDQAAATDAFVSYGKGNERTVLSRSDLVLYASRFAQVLRQHGIKRGDVVTNTLPNSIERIITDMGVILAGAAVVNAIPALTSGEIFYSTLNRCQSKCIIIYPAKDNVDWALVKKGIVPEDRKDNLAKKFASNNAKSVSLIIIVSRCSDWQREEIPDVPNFMQYIKFFQGDHIDHGITPLDWAYIFSTTGTTGMQKLLPRSHKSMMNIAHGRSAVITTVPSRYFSTVKHGWFSGFPFVYLTHGTCLVFIDELNYPEDTGALFTLYWHAFQNERLIAAYLTPSEVDGIVSVDCPGKYMLSIICIGGVLVHKKLVNVMLQHLCPALVVIYGLTETGDVSRKLVQDAQDYVDGDVGSPYEGVEIQVRDDDGNTLKRGQVGNIVVKSPSMFDGYLKSVEKTKSSFTNDGFFVTRDVGVISSDSRLIIKGRKDDVILHGSVVIYPTAIEMVIRRCPDVDDVVVVPVPDPVKGENVCACIVKTPGSSLTEDGLKANMEAMLSYPRNAELPVPQHVFFLDEFPLVQNLKVDRKRLAQMAADHFQATAKL